MADGDTKLDLSDKTFVRQAVLEIEGRIRRTPPTFASHDDDNGFDLRLKKLESCVRLLESVPTQASVAPGSHAMTFEKIRYLEGRVEAVSRRQQELEKSCQRNENDNGRLTLLVRQLGKAFHSQQTYTIRTAKVVRDFMATRIARALQLVRETEDLVEQERALRLNIEELKLERAKILEEIDGFTNSKHFGHEEVGSSIEQQSSVQQH